MSTEPDLVIAVMNDLRGNTTINAIAGTRVYRTDNVPVNPTTPYIVVSDISDTAGAMMADARVQCSCFATKDMDASALSKTVRRIWHRRVNALLPAGLRYIWVSRATDGGNQPDKNPEVSLYAHHRDILINYDYR